MDSLDSDDASSTGVCQKLFSDPEVKAQIACINANFDYLPATITSLEKSGASLQDSIALWYECCTKIREIKSKKLIKVQQRTKSVFEKNIGLE